MTCTEVRELLLTADPATLVAPDDTLGAHLADCPRCRGAHAYLFRAHTALQSSLERGPRASATVGARQALAEGRRIDRRRRRIRGLVPLLAAAAGIATVLLVRDTDVPRATVVPTSSSAVLPPLVEDGADRIAVIRTSRPDVTVVWQF